MAIRYAAGASSTLLAREFETNARWILTCVRRAGGTVRPFRESSRRYEVDHGFFAAINGEAVAYVLGFAYADGCVRIAPAPTFSIALASRDAAHLETLCRLMGATYPIYEYARSSVLCITSERLVADLIRWGVCPNKSLTAVPPELPRDLRRHWWRGVIDGDGHISPKYRVVHLVGTLATVEAFRDFCAEVAPGSRAQVHPVGGGRASWQFALSGARALRVAEALYEGATVVLPRKAALIAPLRAAVEAMPAHA